ncbi:amidohydrolase family protein [Streptomyces sp. NPDC060022]|uniref:amidohydrolase family protein n=1 Tax=Streptomyces sp. NPDC060022 TaxID=3347039 RepID=UPI00369AC8F9
MKMRIAPPGLAPESGLWLASAQLVDGRRVDVLIASGIVTEVVAAGASDGRPGRRLDLGGYLLLGAPAEPHAHLDKTGTFDDVMCDTGELNGARGAWQRWSAGRDRADIVRRAEATLSALVAHGATAVRTHVALHPEENVPVALDALIELRERWRDRVNLQVVPMLSPDTPDELVETAVKAGADRLGGAPYCSPDPEAAVGRLVGLAQEYEIGLDVHTDETLDPGVLTLVTLADLVIARDFPHPVTASHCVSLGQVPPDRLGPIVDKVAEAGIGVVALPLTNLYLQGRGRTPVPRGLTAVRPLLAAGVVVAGGGDNVGDPFNPMGRADPLETASLLVTAAHLTVEQGYSAISDAARQMLGLPPAGPVAGRVADLLAIKASSLTEAVGRATEDRLVFTAGRLVSRVTVRRELFGAVGSPDSS